MTLCVMTPCVMTPFVMTPRHVFFFPFDYGTTATIGIHFRIYHAAPSSFYTLHDLNSIYKTASSLKLYNSGEKINK